MTLYERLGLTREEYRRICELLGREPDLLELSVFSLNWSEHCSYKSSKRLLRRLPTQGPQVVQGPGENAGVVRLKKGWAVAFKVESHNHPSAVEPFHGAATGVGGIIRDVLSVGARPIALLDSLRFGEFSDPQARHLYEGVVSGISFYGNCVGIPTVAGEIYFEAPYTDNPLVNVMCVGLLREEEMRSSRVGGPGLSLLLVGALTGPDGIHGATFASVDLVGDLEEKRPNVQIGDPFKEKLLIEAVLEVRDDPDLVALQDLGAGGLSTAVPEMAHKGGVGAELWLDRVPLRDPNMQPHEILLSESQERMVLAVRPGAEDRILRVFQKWGLYTAVVGRTIPERVLRVKMGGRTLTEIPLSALLDGVGERIYPKAEPPHVRSPQPLPPDPPEKPDEMLLKLLAAPNIASKRPVYRQYDHTVQINTVIRPGEGDAAVLRVKGESFGIAVTIDGNGRFVHLHPRIGAMRVVFEAARNLVAVGARPLAITDCLNFANPSDPEVYWALAQAIEGLREAALTLGTPFVSGNVSLYNQSEARKIYPTPIVGMVGLIEDLERRLDMGLKEDGDSILLVGKPWGKVGGSEYLRLAYGFVGGEIDAPDPAFEVRLQKAVLKLIEEGWINAAHDVSDGGLLVALAEMALAGQKGVRIELPDLRLAYLFGEWESRFLVTVPPAHRTQVLEFLDRAGIPVAALGRVEEEPLFRFGEFALPLKQLEEAYNALERAESKMLF